MGNWDHLPSGKYSWEEAIETLPGGKYYVPPQPQGDNVVSFAERKEKRMECEWYDGLLKGEQPEKANRQVSSRLPWANEVLEKSEKQVRAESESPLKIWWLEQKKKLAPHGDGGC